MFRDKKKEKKILVLIDFENLLKNTATPSPERLSMEEGFNKVINQVTEEVGKIANVFIFAPPHLASLYARTFHELGFFTIHCPKIKDKRKEEKDTTDEILIEFGKKMINQIPDLTHLCLGSGDIDFSSLIKEVKLQGLKTIVIAGNLTSLAGGIINLADKNPRTGGKWVYFFSPTKE